MSFSHSSVSVSYEARWRDQTHKFTGHRRLSVMTVFFFAPSRTCGEITVPFGVLDSQFRNRHPYVYECLICYLSSPVARKSLRHARSRRRTWGGQQRSGRASPFFLLKLSNCPSDFAVWETERQLMTGRMLRPIHQTGRGYRLRSTAWKIFYCVCVRCVQ